VGQYGRVGAARAEIAALLFRYADAVDAGDFANAAELFAHATFRAAVGDGVHTRAGAEEVRDQFERLVITYDGTPATKHLTTNVVIEVDDEGGTATCRSYFTVLQARPDFPLQPIVAGRYHDRFERVDGTWRFVDRLVLTDLVGDTGRHLRGTSPSPAAAAT
jgi:3-phenylpropionate/cinnamic acid dioxygenase small subunit